MTRKTRMVVKHPPPIFLAPYAAINALSHLGIVCYLAFYSMFQFRGQILYSLGSDLQNRNHHQEISTGLIDPNITSRRNGAPNFSGDLLNRNQGFELSAGGPEVGAEVVVIG
jgi:hypothetical protein